MRIFALVALWCLAVTARGSDAPRGQLCFGDDCIISACGASVTPAVEKRPFMLAAAGVRHLGIVDSGAASVECNHDGTAELQVRLPEQAPLEMVRVRFTSEDAQRWAFLLAKRELGRPVLLRISRGAYDIEIDAEKMLPYQTKINVGAVSRKVIAELRPPPVVRGVVVDGETGRGIAGAKMIADGGSEVLAGKHGRFELSAKPREWPKHLTVRAAGFGTRMVAIPATRRSVVLDDIYLRRAATVTAEILGIAPAEIAEVSLVRLRADGNAPGAVVQSLLLGESNAPIPTFRFQDVDAGKYVVIANGAAPSQRAGARIEVTEGNDVTAVVSITPFRLRVRAVLDGQTVSKARVTLRNHDTFWEAKIDTGADGEIAASLWQPGTMSAMVMAAGILPYRVRRTITEALDSEWVLEVPALEITGTVVDSETGTPIADAALSLHMKDGFAVSTRARPDGTFRFAPVVPGHHRLSAGAPGYPPAEVNFTFGEKQSSHRVDVPLRRTPSTMLTVVDRHGWPAAEASVFVINGGATVARTRTGADGRVPIFIDDEESRDVFVLPREGSLGIMRIQSGAADVTMRLPEATARIIVKTESQTREPIRGLTVDVRYNGFLLPDEVMEAFYGRGSRLSSDAEGRIILEQMPPGMYEFLPAGSRHKTSPVQMQARPGENVVLMTFEPIRGR